MASSRERILDSFERILIDEGERAATVEAVATAADVSKGGLLYHFPSKEAMVEALGDRLQGLVGEDLARMTQDPEGAARYYVRTSVYEDSPLDRALVAMARLAQQGHARAQERFSALEDAWLGALEEELGNRAIARAVKLMGDGLYYDAAFFAGDSARKQTPQDMEELLLLVDAIAPHWK
ncbi:TetR/AcrR family transcriptional regulator [Arthrobacter roseus]|uniref:TetR/AcrR family transcriptional regulator n=1 Tax=Arthrobacter roseus TaxID=136274 RepID=UPI0019667278|nr:TetR/AcrR family transcriptional regulator [Arthrobacter roseus]MBM7847050.1 AcrR family transcriptional regulator [Arthrobacter roseus]